MQPSPFFTVAIPTFNLAEMLRSCLVSLFRQSFKNFEIIVAAKASTDETPAVVWAIDDPPIQYLRRERNIGAYDNFTHCSTLGRAITIPLIACCGVGRFEDNAPGIKAGGVRPGDGKPVARQGSRRQRPGLR